MINVEFLYCDAIESLEVYGEHVGVKPLPTAIYLMQQDVINNIEYCSKYSLAKVLDESFMDEICSQDSLKSWVREFNQHSDALYGSVRNLICYTHRLLHDSKLKKYKQDNEFDDSESIRLGYVGIMTDLNYQGALIGVYATEEKNLVVFSLDPPKNYDPTAKYQRIKKSVISVEERGLVQNLYGSMAEESAALVSLSEKYGGLCKEFNAVNDAITPVYGVSKTWWI